MSVQQSGSADKASPAAAPSDNKPTQKYYLKQLKRYERLISSLCIVGILICLYSVRVEIYKSRDTGYVAFCDLGEFFSCSKVLTSKYAKGFGLLPADSILSIPNSIYGLVFFIIQLILLLFRNNLRALRLKVSLSVLANMGSVYLGYILYAVLHDFCIVCVSSYVVNALLLLFNIKHQTCFRLSKEIINSKKKAS